MRRALYIIIFIVAAFLLISALTIQVETTHNPIIDKMKLLLLQLAVILFCAKLGGEFFSKVLKQPAVLGELLAGVAIGPFALGAFPLPILGKPLFPLPPGASTGEAFPISPELYGIATLASVILLFLAGLETDFKQFMKQSLAGTLVGIGGVAGAFVLGDYLTIWFGLADHFMDPVALFMGIISVATSVGITARVLSEQKQLDTAEGTTILAGAVIDDVLGILLLAVVTGLVGAKGHQTAHHGPGEKGKKAVVSHENSHGAKKVEKESHKKTEKEGQEKSSAEIDWSKIGLIGYRAFGFWLGITAIGILLAGFIQRFLRAFNSQGTLVALGLAFALLVSGLAEMVGLAAIIGAYAMGLALSKEKVAEELEHAMEGIYDVLVPVFFCVMGMLVNVSSMLDSSILVFSIVYSLVAVVIKVVGCGLPTYLVGFNTKGAARVGVGMLPRGEVALIIAGVGLAVGVIDQRLFGVAIAMTLITTLMAPPLLVMLFDGTPGTKAQEKALLELEKEEEKKEAQTYKFTISDIDESFSYACLHTITEVLSEEGYDTRLVSREPHIYQVTKEDLAMEIREDLPQVHIDIPEERKGEVKPLLEKGVEKFKERIGEIKLQEGEGEEKGKKKDDSNGDRSEEKDSEDKKTEGDDKGEKKSD